MYRTLLPLAFATLIVASGPAASAGSTPAPAESPKLATVPVGTSAEYALLVPGSGAPDFAYEILTGGHARLRDLRAQGHVLLVFAPDDAQLSRLQRESEALERLGIVPVAVLDWRTGACRNVVKKLGLTFPVAPDPARNIGLQYNVLDARTRQDAPAWFVIDRSGRVRGLDRYDFPREPWCNVAADALGLPNGDVSVPASQKH